MEGDPGGDGEPGILASPALGRQPFDAFGRGLRLDFDHRVEREQAITHLVGRGGAAFDSRNNPLGAGRRVIAEGRHGRLLAKGRHAGKLHTDAEAADRR